MKKSHLFSHLHTSDLPRYALLIPVVIILGCAAAYIVKRWGERLMDFTLKSLGHLVAGALWIVILLPLYFVYMTVR